MLGMSSRIRENNVQIIRWSQGSELRGNKVEVPELRSRRLESSNEYVWEEHDVKTIRLPVEPDALFSLCFKDRPEPLHFCYEADKRHHAHGRYAEKAPHLPPLHQTPAET